MVTVKHTDYPEKIRRYRTGREVTIPARYECRYFYSGREIAFYDSKDDILYLKTDCIGHDFKRSEYDRAMSCSIHDAYKYLFDMLNVDSNTRMSEYTSL